MMAELGNVERNLNTAEKLVRRAFKEGAEMVILPEFFTSPLPSILNCLMSPNRSMVSLQSFCKILRQGMRYCWWIFHSLP
ncbi:nitrilase-related carbon-nitrogen hydrolase [Archaeoglobus sp.]